MGVPCLEDVGDGREGSEVTGDVMSRRIQLKRERERELNSESGERIITNESLEISAHDQLELI